MTEQIERFKKQEAFDSGLELGQRARVRWTNCFRQYEAVGVVAKLNEKSVKVMTDEGRLITVPRMASIFSTARWSWNNGVFPEAAA